ncbi:hypothetical protein A0H81_00485 [Grifola frondosa]|uniref:Secreted protein n=1 Tax=Grifola frondosa TaxID=5627 RepID=A0A1C7MXN1_GRIFR|nr:hypothetical protein A0H81_00485 [Grifola frondosa]
MSRRLTWRRQANVCCFQFLFLISVNGILPSSGSIVRYPGSNLIHHVSLHRLSYRDLKARGSAQVSVLHPYTNVLPSNKHLTPLLLRRGSPSHESSSGVHLRLMPYRDLTRCKEGDGNDLLSP